jgi:hypothetical protein
MLGAQTADQLVTDGRAFLAQRNLTNAHLKFAAAVAASPNHENANAFVSVTRLLNLIYQPPAQNFLTRLGVSATGRDVYHWNAFITKDTNHVPIAPVGVSGAEASPFWRTNALPEITNALANLARITNPNFLLNLTSNETTTAAVTVDYGDLLMLRAGLHFMEYFSYTLLAHDLDVQLTALRALHTNEHLNIERLLADHPHLLTFATTNDMAVARAAFANFADRYAEASDRLRARPPGVTRMFNFAANGRSKEDRFRRTLADLKTSLNGATVLSVDGNYTFFAGAHFSGQGPWRSFLPQFRAHRMVLGTLPDPTLGGLLIGHREDEVEDYLLNRLKFHNVGLNAGDVGRYIATVPGIPQVRHAAGAPFSFTLRAQTGRGYVVQASTNLVNWEAVGAFVALSSAVDFTETAGQHARRFYRIVDRDWWDMPAPGNDNFTNAVALAGSPTSVVGYNRGARAEVGENLPFPRVGKSVWYTWTAPSSGAFSIQANGNRGFYPTVTVFTGSSLGTLSTAAGGYNDSVYLSAVGGQVYRIAVDGSYWNYPSDGGFKLIIGRPPTVSFISPVANTVFPVGTSTINVEVSASDADDTIVRIEIYGRNGPLATLTNAPYQVVITNLSPGIQSFSATAYDRSGLSSTAFVPFTLTAAPPGNDNFANAVMISGGSYVSPLVNNVFATKETGEPNHASEPGGGSVWWSWIAPKTGTVTIDTIGSSFDTTLGIYTGAAVNSLIEVTSDDESGGNNTSRVVFTATSGVTYRIGVDGYFSSRGNIRLNLNQP